mmetsp:Transcript_35921/g.100402  ORF Transcript_35921/g.100402 Transcript_35921/m.100402 type:complete len:214 (+) Transcript_35921:175-816(+)
MATAAGRCRGIESTLGAATVEAMAVSCGAAALVASAGGASGGRSFGASDRCWGRAASASTATASSSLSSALARALSTSSSFLADQASAPPTVAAAPVTKSTTTQSRPRTFNNRQTWWCTPAAPQDPALCRFPGGAPTSDTGPLSEPMPGMPASLKWCPFLWSFEWSWAFGSLPSKSRSVSSPTALPSSCPGFWLGLRAGGAKVCGADSDGWAA